jgi:hypothetical protein
MILEEAHTQFCGITYQTVSAIAAGSEIYTSYGDETWFTTRNVQLAPDLPLNEIHLSELQAGGAQCLSHLYVEESTIPMAGKGVFSRASYEEGDTVYISPLLVLPKHQLQKYKDENVLLNYCISEEESDAALLPIGLTGMLNHGGAGSNVCMEWHTEQGDASRLRLPVEELEALPFAPLDVRYVATRPLARDEELLLDYGASWSEQWLQHLDTLIEWNEHNTSHLALKPQFRQPIGAPEGFFPVHFRGDCIGKTCRESYKTKRREAIVAMAKKQKLRELYEAAREATVLASGGGRGGAGKSRGEIGDAEEL